MHLVCESTAPWLTKIAGSSRRSDDSGNAGGSNPQRPGQGRPRRGVRWDEEVQEYGPAEGDIEGVEEDPDWQQVQAEGSYQPSAPLSFGAGEESEPAYGTLQRTAHALGDLLGGLLTTHR